jgi:peptide/nickel transport system substrate-binding protein
VGTGPFKLVKSDAGSIVYDRRDTWWAVEAGVAPAMPAVERVIFKPATVDAVPQLFTNNEIDIGRALQVGAFEAAKARNPGPRVLEQVWPDLGRAGRLYLPPDP